MLRRCLERDPRRRLHHIADARIEIEDAANDPEEGASALVTASSRRRERVLGVSTAALALALAAALGAWFLRPPADVPELRVVEITTPRTSDPWSFAISPDGRRLAFVADHDGQPTLWVRALDAADARALPGTEGARRPFWSPDSRSIGFFANSELKRIEARGGSAQTVTYALAGTTAAWGPDGTILFSSTAAPSLRRVNAAGGTVEAATTPAAGVDRPPPSAVPARGPAVPVLRGRSGRRARRVSGLARVFRGDASPGVRHTGGIRRARLAAVRPPGNALGAALRSRTTDGRAASRSPLRTPSAFEPIDGTGAFSTSDAGVMAYRAGRPSVTRLSWFDRSGNALGTLGSPEQAGLSNLRLSPDGRRVAAERTLQNETDLWLLDSTRQTRFTRGSDGSIARLPVWSPDGGRIAFESVRSGSVALSVKPSTGDGAEDVLFESPEIKIPCDWSPDGRFLVYYVPDPKTGTDLWVLPLGHAGAVRLPQDRGERAVGPVLPGRALGGVPIERNREI